MVGVASKGGRWRRVRRKVASSGPLPWLLGALLVASSTLVVPPLLPHPVTVLPEASWQEVTQRLSAQAGTLVEDTDLDGLPDGVEVYGSGTNPQDWDTAGLGIPDGWLVDWGYDPLDPHLTLEGHAPPPPESVPAVHGGAWPTRLTPSLLMVYSVGRPPTWDEATQGPFRNGIDPREWDGQPASAPDGVPDGWLILHGIDPREPGLRESQLAGPEGLTVLQAFEADLDPRSLDSDGDGLTDVEEQAGHAVRGGHPFSFDPTNPRAWSSAGSQVCDGYLVVHGLDARSTQTAANDPDRDGATTAEEFAWSHARFGAAACQGNAGLDPVDATSGDSAIPDGWHLRYGLDPLSPGIDQRSTEKVEARVDRGLLLPAVTLDASSEYRVNRPPDWNESASGPWMGGSRPDRVDTDGDGVTDAHELQGWAVNASRIPGRVGPGPQRVTSDPNQADADRDGLSDGLELALGTDPNDGDTDSDRIPDGVEAALARHLALDRPEEAIQLSPFVADSAGDLLLDGERLENLTERADLVRLDPNAPFPFPGPVGGARSVLDVARLQDGAAEQAVPATAEGLADFFGVGGNVDGDDIPNLLDPDMDGDGLLNGWEWKPSLYAQSPFATSLAGGRSVTDALTKDTDGDGLFDGWEVPYSRLVGGVLNPDAALADTDHDGISDAAEDLDGDTISLHKHTNLAEQAAGTDPWNPTTDDDGLLDGWKYYWGALYTGPRNDRPGPKVGVKEPATDIETYVVTRFTTDAQQRLAGETVGKVHLNIGPQGRAVTQLDYTVHWTYLAMQENETHPYLVSGDGDDAPDAIEAYNLFVRLRGDDAQRKAAGCLGVPPAHFGPTADGSGKDSDGDGLEDDFETLLGTNPLCKDTDLGGVADGTEAGLTDALDPSDDLGLADSTEDSDGDGVLDFAEVTRVPRTDALNPDSDGDGLLDGKDIGTPSAPAPADSERAIRFLSQGIAFRKVTGGYVFLGEQDAGGGFKSQPMVPDTKVPGVPDGWVLSHGGAPAPSWRTCYDASRPLWWQLDVHGPWWGGGDPSLGSCAAQVGEADGDRDGLIDAIGEDPLPANRLNHLTKGSPFEAGLSAAQIRERAQAVVDPRIERTYRVAAAPATSSPPSPHDTRLDLEPLPNEAPVLNITLGDSLPDGKPLLVNGTLVNLTSNAAAPATTVIARIAGEDLGVAFTLANGSFSLNLQPQGQHAIPVPEGRVLRGQTRGTATWTANLDKWVPGPTTVDLYAYATPGSGGTATLQGQASASASVPANLFTQLVVAIDAPSSVRPGETFDATVSQTDLLQRPRTEPMYLLWRGDNLTLFPNSAGQVRVTLPAPAAAGNTNLKAGTHSANQFVLESTSEVQVRVRGAATLLLDPLPVRLDAGQDRLDVRGRLLTDGVPQEGKVEIRVDGPDGKKVLNATVMADTAGRFRAAFHLPASLRHGTHVVAASVAATSQHGSASTTGTFQVREVVQLIDPTSASLAATGARELQVVLLNASGLPLAGYTIEFSLDGPIGVATTGATGKAGFLLTQPLSAGPHLQRVQFMGDDAHQPATLERQRSVTSPTTLTLEPATGRPGGLVSFAARLNDAAGAPLPGRLVEVEVPTLGQATAFTDAHGNATLRLELGPSAPTGLHLAQARFAGDLSGANKASTAVATLHLRRPVILGLPSLLLGPGPIEGTAVDDRGQPVAGITLQVQGPGLPATTISNDTGRFLVDPRTEIPLGDLPVHVLFPGDATNEGNESSGTVHVRAPARLRLVTPHGLAGDRTLIDFEVLDQAGLALRQGVLRLGFDNTSLVVPVVAGHARSEIQPTQPGDLALAFEYVGPTHAAEGQASLPILRSTHLVVELQPAQRGATALLELRMTSDTDPVSGATLAVQVEGLASGFKLVTDDAGRVRLPLPLDGDERAFRVQFAGSTHLAPARLAIILDPDVAATSGPGAAPLWWVAGATLALVLAAVPLALMLGRRRNPFVQALLRAERLLEARGPHEADIFACYAGLQESLQAAGALTGPARTAHQLGARLASLAPAPKSRQAIDRLIAIFEGARYGTRPADARARDAARGHLRTIRRALLRRGIPMEVAA